MTSFTDSEFKQNCRSVISSLLQAGRFIFCTKYTTKYSIRNFFQRFTLLCETFKNGETYFKNPAAFSVRFSKCVRLFRELDQ